MRRGARRGLTLLETLVAAAALASMTTLCATLWAQVAKWTGEGALPRRALRTPHALGLLRAQWSARAEGEPVSSEGPARAVVSGERLEFVTTRSVLFESWPRVRAGYVIEEGESGARLVYEETRLGTADALGATLDQGGRRVELLGGCARLAWSAVAGAAEGETEVERDADRWMELTRGAGSAGGAALASVADPRGVRLVIGTDEGSIECVLIDADLR